MRISRHAPAYVEERLISSMLSHAQGTPRDYLILLLMALAGLRRREVVNLTVANVGDKALRFRDKGDKIVSCQCPRRLPQPPTLLHRQTEGRPGGRRR